MSWYRWAADEFKLIGWPRPNEDPDVPVHPPLGGLTAQRMDEALLDVLTHVAKHHPSHITSQVAGARKLPQAFRAATPGSQAQATLHRALRAIAAGHAEHPDFDPAWRLWPAANDPWST